MQKLSAPTLVRRAAFHEAGHVLVAVKLGVRIQRGIGMCIDDSGRGYAALCLRPDHPSDDYPVSRATEVKVLLAGGIAEKRFDRKSRGKSTAGDENRIRGLQAEDPSLSDLAPLETESRELISKNWDVVRQLAERLLRKNPERRIESGPWTESECEFARYLFGEEISEVLPEAKALLLGGAAIKTVRLLSVFSVQRRAKRSKRNRRLSFVFLHFVVWLCTACRPY